MSWAEGKRSSGVTEKETHMASSRRYSILRIIYPAPTPKRMITLSPSQIQFSGDDANIPCQSPLNSPTHPALSRRLSRSSVCSDNDNSQGIPNAGFPLRMRMSGAPTLRYSVIFR